LFNSARVKVIAAPALAATRPNHATIEIATSVSRFTVKNLSGSNVLVRERIPAPRHPYERSS